MVTVFSIRALFAFKTASGLAVYDALSGAWVAVLTAV